MRRYLTVDEATREYRLVITDLWDGQHERTEFRVLTDSGDPLRARAGTEDPASWTVGRPVQEDRGAFYPYYVTDDRLFRTKIRFRVENTATGPTVITTCRRLASKSGRARCPLCAERDPDD